MAFLGMFGTLLCGPADAPLGRPDTGLGTGTPFCAPALLAASAKVENRILAFFLQLSHAVQSDADTGQDAQISISTEASNCQSSKSS